MYGHRSLVVCAWLAVLLIFASVSTALAAERVLGRFDLSRPADFEQFKGLGIAPFCRLGNVFFAEVDAAHLAAVRQAKVPYAIVDEEPAGGHYYLGAIESLLSKKIPTPELERLADVGDHALYKSMRTIDPEEFRRYGFELFEVRQQEIPLVYFAEGTASPNPAVATADPVLDALLAAIRQDSVYAYDARLEAFRTRLSLSDSNTAARIWIRQKFLSFGYTDVTFDQFWLADNRYGGSGWCYNVVCRKPGTTAPDKVVVIGGHYDSIVYGGGDPYTYAPGADDDGSGTAATLEIARVLAGIPTKKTIIFIAFAAEESGLEGSYHYAQEASSSGMDIEVMLNMDMIGFTADSYPNIACEYFQPCRPYSELMAQMATDHTWLYPQLVGASSSSDHYPFYQWGFNIASTIEGDFNTAGWHTELDLTSRMNFPYLTEAVKMCLATLYTVSTYPSTVAGARARDVGDGQSLRVEWTALTAPNISGYRVYWSRASKDYTDSVDVPGGSSSQVTVNGLTEGWLYYFTVIAIDTDGRESFLRPEFTGTPLVVPLAPGGLIADPALWQVQLSWQPNQELDLDHYNIYRGTTPGVYMLRQVNWTGTSFVDDQVSSGVMYEYVVTAVDGTAHESARSSPVTAAAATFDQGILILDATAPTYYNPTTEQKQAFFSAIFSGYPTSYYYYDPLSESLNKSIMGQYAAIFWLNDANGAGVWRQEDVDKLRWYLGYNTNVLLAGWRVAFEFSGLTSPKTLSPGNLLYDYAGVTTTSEVTDVDFEGAIGQTGLPNVALDPAKVYEFWQGKMGWIGVLNSIRSGTETIYTFDSYSGAHTGKRVGVRRDNGTNKFMFLSMPFYYLRNTDAQAVVDSAVSWFGVAQTCDCAQFCDANRDGAINPADVVLMVNYVYRSGPSPLVIPLCYQGQRAVNGDWNCDGRLNPIDVVYYVSFVYKSSGVGPCNPCNCSPYPSSCP